VRRLSLVVLALLLLLPLFGDEPSGTPDGIDPRINEAITKAVFSAAEDRLSHEDVSDLFVSLSSFRDDGLTASVVVTLSYRGAVLKERLSVPSGKWLERRFATQLSGMLAEDLSSLVPATSKFSLGSEYLGQYSVKRGDSPLLRKGTMVRAEGPEGGTGLFSVATQLEDVALLEVRSDHGVSVGQRLEKTHGWDAECYGLYGKDGYGGEIAAHVNQPFPFRLVMGLTVQADNLLLAAGLEGMLPFSVLGNGWFLRNSSLSLSTRFVLGTVPVTAGSDVTLTYRFMVTPMMHVAIAGRVLYYPQISGDVIWKEGYAVLVGGGIAW